MQSQVAAAWGADSKGRPVAGRTRAERVEGGLLKRDGASAVGRLGGLESSVAKSAADEGAACGSVDLAVFKCGPVAGSKPGRGGEHDHGSVARAELAGA